MLGYDMNSSCICLEIFIKTFTQASASTCMHTHTQAHTQAVNEYAKTIVCNCRG